MAVRRIPFGTVDEETLEEKLGRPVSSLQLSVRTINCLEGGGIDTVKRLLNKKREELLAIPNFGDKTLEEVFKALEELGFNRK